MDYALSLSVEASNTEDSDSAGSVRSIDRLTLGERSILRRPRDIDFSLDVLGIHLVVGYRFRIPERTEPSMIIVIVP